MKGAPKASSESLGIHTNSFMQINRRNQLWNPTGELGIRGEDTENQPVGLLSGGSMPSQISCNHEIIMTEETLQNHLRSGQALQEYLMQTLGVTTLLKKISLSLT